MRVCLINPPWFTKRGNIWNQIRSTMPPLGLLYLASKLEKEGIDVDIFDFQARLISWDEIEDKIKSREYDFYGITSTTVIVNNGYRIASLVKKHYPRSRVVFGGVHVTALPEEALLKDSVDYVIRGEGEEAFLKLIKGSDFKTIQGLSYRNSSEIHHIKPDGIISDLDSLPFPAFHKIDLRLYKPAFGAYKRLPAINMMTTRGCPGRCTFCNSANIPLRKRSAESIYSEMEMLTDKYGIREISFYDDTFTVYHKNIERLCELLIRNKLDLTWCCFARTDCVSAELLARMKAGGCHQVMYGIETADSVILNNIKKNIDHSKNKKAVEMAKKAKITTRCTFMFGNPGETEETIEKTIRYSIELNPDIALYNITTPYPGTEMFKWAKDNGYLATENWDDYDLSEPVMRLPTISVEALCKKYKKAFKDFYFRPAFIFKKIFNLSSFNEIFMLLEGLKRIYSFTNLN